MSPGGTNKRSSISELIELVQSTPMVTEFSGDDGCHIDHGYFWGHDAGTDLGAAFYWEAWVKPLGSGYLVSDGYGGAHAFLWGFVGSDGGPYTVTGNVWSSIADAVSFSGIHRLAHEQWAHIAVGLSGGKIYTWVNGVGDTLTSFSGIRTTLGTASGCGKLYVGGSDHLNGTFRLAALRGWDRGEYVPSTLEAFAPERSWLPSYSNSSIASFMAEYVGHGAIIIPDYGRAISATGGISERHPGRRIGVGAFASAFLQGPQTAPGPGGGGPFPTFVLDEDCPYGRQLGTTTASVGVTQIPESVPSGAVVFDSFNRAEQTWAFQQVPSLGSTEGGSAGPLVWQSDGEMPFGILDGQAVFLGRASLGTLVGKPAWVMTGITNQDVRITRRVGGTVAPAVGIVFRLIDGDNFWFVYAYPDGTTCFLGSYTAGVETVGTTFFNISSGDTVIRVVASGTTITVFTGDGETWTQREQRTGQTLHQAGQGTGIIGPHSFTYTPLAGFGRWDDFTVLAG